MAILLTLSIIVSVSVLGWMIYNQPEWLSRIEKAILGIILFTAVFAGTVTIGHIWMKI